MRTRKEIEEWMQEDRTNIVDTARKIADTSVEVFLDIRELLDKKQ